MDQNRNHAAPLEGFRGGTEWMVDASGCVPDALRNLVVIGRICQRVVDDLGLKVVGTPQQHAFGGPGGVTALYLLSESHLACHTYPEYGFATFNLYCCRRRPPWKWRVALTRELGAAEVIVREVHRDLRLAAKESLQ